MEQLIKQLDENRRVYQTIKQSNMENEKQQLAQQITKPVNDQMQLLIDIAAEAKRAQRSEQHYLQLATDLDNTVHSLKHERENLLKKNNELMGQLTQLTAKLAKKQKR